MMFKNIKGGKEGETSFLDFNWSKIIIRSLLALIILVVVSYLGIQAKSTYDKVSSNWQEIQFAYEKPALVKAVREDYQNKQLSLDQSFLKKEKTSEDKLLDEVANQLKDQSK